MFAFPRNFLSPEICFGNICIPCRKVICAYASLQRSRIFGELPHRAVQQFAISKNSSTIFELKYSKLVPPKRKKMPASETKLKLNIQFQPLADTTPKIRSLQNVKVFESSPPSPPAPLSSPYLCPTAAAKCKQISNMQRMLLGNEKWNWNWTENSASDTWPTTFCYFFWPAEIFLWLALRVRGSKQTCQQGEEGAYTTKTFPVRPHSLGGANQSSSQLQFSA